MANLYQPIVADAGPPPVVVRIVVPASNQMMSAGVPVASQKVEPYVLLSALPEDLRRRVELAVQALIAAR
jgi:hypothetical protein